ncbi:MAG: phage holin family protein [Ruminococcus sp.]|nr:phage holin family protein [Ruminococcus sp.]
MEILKEFISEYATTILYAIVTAIAGYIGIVVKNIYQKHCDSKTKKDVAKTVVGAIEQIYKDLHGQEKYDKAVEAMSEMLAEKGISISELEIKMLIEAAVSEFNQSFVDVGEFATEYVDESAEGT